MAKHKLIASIFGLLAIPVTLIMIAGLLWYSTTLSLCQPCEGWDIINPLCHSSFLACTGSEGVLHTIVFGAALVVFIAGIGLLILGVMKLTQ